ncbi:hypothetical protein RM555_11385 [Micromonospora sp. DSM 115977]|uniref:Uncharacterized protein n=1 Tax=Micromonospora reichwaldensis TaxID=3075516 RepID=A0ABU2WUI4_9ACTN|nr:hypothetical protein [Micromonospora sp. DSM 115977]MDT0529589.1 hypothetical protein [Micromonospora sp. DSM 115977]
MSQPDELDENWLNGEEVVCPECQERLYRVDHSPLLDCYFLYCDGCPMRVDVSYYDSTAMAIADALPARDETHPTLMAALEARLRRCDCGGRFRDSAPRRCHRCATVLATISAPSGVDVWPGWWTDETDTDSLEEEFTARYFRAEGLWKH